MQLKRCRLCRKRGEEDNKNGNDIVTPMYAMEWRRLLGALNIDVPFANEPYKRDLYSAKQTSLFLRSSVRVGT